ncbi:MAG: hypothetical protein HYR56_04410 [Acidobacteria bacterium]|nr:hypothetical protein [Acidobacteriota bacterium]MBI3421724.1 hypothetical protein [Acidobacteriota bacterium]
MQRELRSFEHMWKITKDFTENPGTVGVSSRDYDESKVVRLKHLFQLYDADGVAYFEGLSDEADSQRAFAPLDDFGRGCVGCVEIKYQENDIWMPL